MYVVVNHLPLNETVNWLDLESKINEFQARLSKQRPEFRGVSLVKINDTCAILLVLFDNLEALNDISKNIAAPWFAEHVRHYLDGPVDRQVGEIVAGRMV